MSRDKGKEPGISLAKGLPMFAGANSAALEKEKQELASVQSQSLGVRGLWWGTGCCGCSLWRCCSGW
jgi:hypothetical protein